jgi:Pyruvate/2-oxoacid:ferredoxin oxidoreductase delta subunit
MGIKHKITTNFVKIFGRPRIEKLIVKQRSTSELDGALLPTSNSPMRFEIPFEMLNLIATRDDIQMRHMFPVRRLLSVIKNIQLSVDSIPENPVNVSTQASPVFLENLREFAKSHGVTPIEFVKLPHDLIFKKMGVLYDNAIILAMEMSKEKIDKAASQATLTMVFGTYDDLGKAANRIAEFLREHGYAAQADHPLGGLVLFPPLAQKAGIGWIGKHGLLITPEFGPRVRLAAVYTSIENLPFMDSNEHGWIDEYCKSCGICIKQCPPQAILEGTVTNDTGRVTNIKQQECFEYFAQYYGCSICVKVCPFSKAGDTYERLKAVVEKKF